MGEKTSNIINIQTAKKKRVFFLFGLILILGFFSLPLFINENITYLPTKDNPNSMNHPKSSAIINFTIYLFDISLDNSSAYRGDEIILRGWAEKANISLGQMVPANGHTLYVLIDDILDQSFSGDTDSNGNFTLVFPIPYDYDINSYMKIQADLSPDVTEWESKCFNQFYLEIDARLNVFIDELSQGPAFAYSSNPGFENYRISGHIELDDGSSYTGPNFPMNFTFGDNGDQETIQVTPSGTFDHTVWLREGFAYYTLNFSSTSDYAGFNDVFEFNVISNILINFEEYPNPGYQNRSTVIRGTVTAIVNGESVPLSPAGVNVSFLGSNYLLLTEIGGVFQIFIDIPPNNLGIQPITATLVSYQGNAINAGLINGISFTASVDGRIELAPPEFPYEIVIIVVVAITAIVGVFLFQRWRLKNADTTDKLKLTKKEEARLDIISILLLSGRIKEAIAYLYIIYIDLSVLKYGIERKQSQTFRDFAIMMVKEYGQNPQTIYPFMLEIEKVVYGGFPVSQQTFIEIKTTFAQLFLEITGHVLSLEV